MSIENNEFDLSRLVSKNNDSNFEVVQKQYDMSALLKGYKEVPQSEWHNFAKNTHIRYLRKDGLFKPGGYIFSIEVKAVNGKDQVYLALSWGSNARFPKFEINLDTIEKIWKRDGAPPPVKAKSSLEERIAHLEGQLKQHNEYFVKMAKIINGIDSKLANISKRK
jgi:hypothetical protein